MKSFLKNLISYLLIASQIILCPQITYSATTEVVDDNGETHVVDVDTRRNFGYSDLKAGDVINDNGKTYQITKTFEVEGRDWFLYTELGDADIGKSLTDPNTGGGKVLLDNARFKGQGDKTSLDLSDGAPRSTPFTDGELIDAYHRAGYDGEPNSSAMGSLQAAAYNTEKRFFENYYNSLVNQSTEEVSAAKSELASYDLNSEAYPDVPVSDTDDGLVNFQEDNKPYLSSHADEFEKLRQRLNASISKSPQQWDANQAARKIIRDADNAYLNNQNDLGNVLLETGKFLVDIATDVIPFTSIPKDGYRLLVGKDPITGEPLSSFERALAGAFIAGAILTAGGTNVLKLEISSVKAIAKATETETRLAEKLTQVIAKSPLTVEVLTKGTSGEFTVIGRDMARVTEVGTALKNEGISVNTLDNFSEAANTEWKRMLQDYVKKDGDRIPSEVVQTSLRYSENQKWLKEAIEKGHTIIDLGNPMAREFSAFYEMEKGSILKYIKEGIK